MAILPRCATGLSSGTGTTAAPAITGWTTIPAGPGGTAPVAGDLVIITGGVDAASQTVTQTGGTGTWTILTDVNTGWTFRPTTVWLAYRYWDGTETAPTFTWGTSSRSTWVIMAFAPDPGNTVTIDVWAADLNDSAAASTHTPNPATVTAGNTDLSMCMATIVGSANAATGSTFSPPPTGWTVPSGGTINNSGTASRPNLGTAFCYRASQTGTVTPGAWTLQGSGTTTTAYVQHVLLTEIPAAASPMPAQPGQTWLRRFHRRQSLPWPPAPAAAAPGVAGSPPSGFIVTRRPIRPVYGGIGAFSNTPPAAAAAAGQRQLLTIPRRAPARGVWRGTAPVTSNRPAGNPPGGAIYRRRTARGLWAGTTARTINHGAGQTQPPAVRQPRRTAPRGLWAGTVSRTTNTPSGAPPRGTIARRRPARGLWAGTVSRTTNTPPGNVPGTAPDHLVIARRSAARGTWAGTVSRTTNTPSGAPPGGTIARRRPARALWAGTVVRTANAVPGRGVTPPHVIIGRRATARGTWRRGTGAPPRVPAAATGGLVRRRRPAGVTWRGWVSRTVNQPPPPFTIGQLTTADVARNQLTAAGAASSLTTAAQAAAALTASDKRTGGPGG